MRDLQHFRQMMDGNPAASWGVSLAAVNCNYDPATIRYEGIAERARLALERAGWELKPTAQG